MGPILGCLILGMKKPRPLRGKRAGEATPGSLKAYRGQKIFLAPKLDGVRAGFPGADPNRFLNSGDEDFAVPDLSGGCRLLDRFQNLG